MVAFFGVTHVGERAMSNQLVRVYNTLPFDLGLTLLSLPAWLTATSTTIIATRTKTQKEDALAAAIGR